MSTLARAAVTFIAWSASALLIAPLCLFAGLLLAGPHSSMLPSFLQPVVWVFGWLVVLAAPLLAARWVWRRTGRAT